MKKIFSLLSFLLVAMVSQAEDAFSVAKVNIKPGEVQTVSVNLTNEQETQGVAVDITLPEGLSFVDADGNVLTSNVTGLNSVTFSDRVQGFSSKGGNYNKKQDLLRVTMGNGGSMAAGEGEIFTFKIKAATDASIGVVNIQYKNLKITYGSTTKTLTNMESEVNIYDLYKVTVAANNAEMGSVEGAQDEAMSGVAITVKATANEGYEFVNWTEGTTEVATTAEYTFTPTKDIDLTANFKAKQYTITFDSDGGSAVADITADYKSTLTKPADPTKTGYTFAGWDPEFPETMPLNGAALKAKWTPIEYAITYDLAGGALAEGDTNPATYTIESAAITLKNPTKTGYTFAGWTGTDLTEASTAVTIAAGSTGARAYTATWTINQYTVTFYDEDGTTEIAKSVQDYDSDIVAPDMTGKTNGEGVPFAAWDPEVPAKVPANDVSFKAIYGGTYDVIFIVDGTEVQKTSVDWNTTITAPADPTKEGYTFAGWLSQEDKALSEYPTMPAKALTFTAQWTINQYTITFVLGNGAENVVLTQDYATTITAPADPVREGYTFAGWDPAVPATVPAQDLTITAKWTINQYTITFKLENGDNDVVLTQDYATAITAPTGFEKEGYTFAGWDAEVPATVPAQDLTFTAQWTINQYTLTFLADGAEFKKLTQDYGTAVKADFEAPDKEGYIWRGWDAEVPETMPAEDMTFNAVYEEFDGIVWNFKQTKALAGLITASADQWERTTANGTFRFTYQPKTNVEPLMLGEEELADTKGLLFKGGVAKFRIDANSRLGMNGKNLQIIIPGLKRTQKITIECQSANSNEERTFTVSDNLEIVSGFEATTAKQVNIANVTTSGDAIFTTTNGMNITRIIVDAALLPETAEIAADELREELNKAIELYNSATASDEATAKLDQALIDAALLLASYDAGEEVTIEQLAECKDKLMEAEAAFENAIITTGISNVTTAAQQGVEAYTLGGQKVNLMKGNSQRKGIYIINGKKVVK